VREGRRIASATSLATLALVIALGIRPLPAERIVAAYVIVLAAIALASLTRIVSQRDERHTASRLELALRERVERPQRPPELIRVERELVLGSSSAGHLHRRLLPILRDVAATRLAANHEVDLDRRPGRARELLGDEAWELLRPDRPEPADRNAPGLPLARIRSLVDRLEAL